MRRTNSARGRTRMGGNGRTLRCADGFETQAIGAAPDALRMQRVVNFYEKLPRGAAPEVKAKGLLGRYKAKHFGKNPTAMRTLSPTSGRGRSLVCFREPTDMLQPSFMPSSWCSSPVTPRTTTSTSVSSVLDRPS